MKKTVLSIALLTVLYSCNNTSATKTTDADNKTAKTEQSAQPVAAPAAEASLVGKWHVTDMKMTETKKGDPTPEQLTASAQSENVIYEFTADGNNTVTCKSLAPTMATYKKDGNKLEFTDKKDGKVVAFEIEKMTDKELVLRSNEEHMSFVMQKM